MCLKQALPFMTRFLSEVTTISNDEMNQADVLSEIIRLDRKRYDKGGD